ncbi:MAG: carboxypeptidase-like regulatory domain-containing protein, partial [Bacteroidota bacterium]
MNLSLFFCSILLSIHVGFSQSLVTGRVTDVDTSEPLIGAHIYLIHDWRKGAVTDINGEFQLALEKKDLRDSLIISFVGFSERILPIRPEMDIQLDPIKIEGETVVVTAKPLISEEFKYVEIKKLEIYTNPAAKADPILAVNSLPSATTTDESANISLRGSSPIETSIYFNNVPIYDAVRYSQLNGIGTFSIFNTDIIKNVTVFPGN